MAVDLKTLEQLADQMNRDAGNGISLNTAAVHSIADIIRLAIGAPLNWPSRVAGEHAADGEYPGSPSLRLAFNAGVKWAVESYQPTATIRPR